MGGRSSGGGNGHPLQYSCLENSRDGGTWWATEGTQSDTTMHACRRVTERQTLSWSKEDQTSTVVMNFYRAAMDTVREGAGGTN